MKSIMTSYAGMLDRSGFEQWYNYVRQRTSYGYEMEEVSFLMSRSPFYFPDFERLEVGTKITPEDETVLSEIFREPYVGKLTFDKEQGGTFEKRMIRVWLEENSGKISYRIAIPWKIKGQENIGHLKLREEKRNVTAKEESEIRHRVGLALNKLIQGSFFRCNRPVLEIYNEVEERCQWPSCLRPAHVKRALYQELGAGNLLLRTVNGRLSFSGISE